jgi:hypothetical protein
MCNKFLLKAEYVKYHYPKMKSTLASAQYQFQTDTDSGRQKSGLIPLLPLVAVSYKLVMK